MELADKIDSVMSDVNTIFEAVKDTAEQTYKELDEDAKDNELSRPLPIEISVSFSDDDLNYKSSMTLSPPKT